MASAQSSKIIRAPGRVVLNPTTEVADTAFPYGGIEIGKFSMFALANNSSNLVVESEGLGAVTEVLEGSLRWAVSFMLRGWDRDAIELLFPDGYDEGAETQHAVFSVPGVQTPGASALARAVKLLMVPDDVNHAPGLLVYRGVPDWQPGVDIAFRRSNEFVLPVMMECVQDASGRILSLGRIHDLVIA